VVIPLDAKDHARFAPVILAPARAALARGEPAFGFGVARGDVVRGAAVATVWKDGSRVELLSLVVAGGERRQGVAGALLDAVIAGAKARGARELVLRYGPDGKPSAPAVLALLARRGFEAPRPLVDVHHATRDEVAALPWLQRARLAPSFEAFPWRELRDAERRQLEQVRWYAAVEDPFAAAADPALSLGLRRGGEVVAWLLASRVLGDAVLWHTLAVRRDLRGSGVGLALAGEAARRALAVPELARWELAIDATNEAMLEFAARHLTPRLGAPVRTQLFAKRLAIARPARAGLTSLVELLRGRAASRPERVRYTFLASGDLDGPRHELTGGELDRRARAVAALLQERARPGDRALLVHPPGLDFLAAFFGCLYAGVIAVPGYPPANRRHVPRLLAMLDDSGARVVLTTASLRAEVAAWRDGLDVVATDDLAPGLEGAWRETRPAPDDVALLQYTSGSTGTPRGVQVLHRNLLANLDDNRAAGNLSEETRFVSWLPHFHDFGLVANLLLSLHVDGELLFFAPAAFLQRPRRWLEAITRFRATFSAAPSFAYDLCARRLGAAEREGLDLSTWTIAVNGSEPVRAAPMERFVEAFGPRGFRREAFMPCYGLAEATLTLTWTPHLAGPIETTVSASLLERGLVGPPTSEADARRLVGSGRPLGATELVIVDADGRRRAAPAEVGEIWVAGDSVTAGYFARPDATEATFGARLMAGGPYLRTGDLGFLRDGQLYVTGRSKELIIVRGRNLAPQDVEATVEASHPALRSASSAAFSLEDGGEEVLAVVAEVERTSARALDTDAVVSAVRAAVAAEHELELGVLALVAPVALPRTSSGKTRRGAARERLVQGRLDGLLALWRSDGAPRGTATAPSAASDPEAWLRAAIARAAGVDEARLAATTRLDDLGLDSLATAELAAELEARLSRPVSPTILREHSTIGDLARALGCA
jgi:acyl-CoA synthetase (AMP-forming)/AMP-acid ligase II/acyl carrier protein/GNAT superfamily N-acetyltransferase